MTKYVMGIDNGSQSTKVAIFDVDGNEICYGSKSLLPTSLPEPGVVIHPEDDLWDSVLGGIEDCLKKFEGNKEDILGIGLCTIRCCRALVKKDGSLAQPILSWMDERLSRPYEHEDDNVAYVTTTSGYLANRLTGEFRDTFGNQEVYWPIDLETSDWSTDEKVLRENGVPREMLFDLVRPGEAFGAIKDELAAKFGFIKGIPVVATSNDKAVEVLGAGIVKENQIMISLGTFISSMIFRNNYFENAQNFFPTLSCVPNKYVYESNGIRRGMWTVSWFKKLLGDDLTNKASELGLSEENYLNKMAEDIPVGSDGLITILDWLASPSIPYRKGVMIGFDGRHTKYHMYRSILEAIGYNIKNNIDHMLEEVGDKIDEIVVTGGGSNSDLMVQIISDMFGVKAVTRAISSSACLGAAICTLKYLGYYGTLESASKELSVTKKEYQPNMDNYEIYNKVNNKVVKNVRKYTDEILKVSFEIFN